MSKKNIGIISQLYWKLLPSQIFCSMVACLSTIINGLIVGNSLDSNSIAALGLVGVLSAFVGTFSSLVSGGARIVCGKHIGRGEFDKVNSAFSACLVMLVIFGGVITLSYVFLATPIAQLLGATGSIIETTSVYIRANALGLLPLVISPCLMSFLDMNNQSKYSLLCASILAMCSLVFGLINIKVLHGGLFGIGIASSLSQIVCLVCLALRFFKDKNLPHIELKKLELSSYKEIIILGLPSALVVLYQVRNVFLNRFAGSIGGEEALTALSILNTCGGLFDSIAVGVGSTTLMISSVIYGEGDRNSLCLFFKFAAKTSVIINSLKGLVLAISSTFIAKLFGADGSLLSLTSNLLLWYAIAMPLNGFPLVCNNTYPAIGKDKFVNIIQFFNCFIFPIGFVVLSMPFLGVYSVWMSYAIAEVLMITTLIIISTIKNKHLPRNILDILMLDDNFGTKPEDTMSITVTSVDEVVNVSKAVSDFAKSKGADDKRVYIVGLCLEEMASNVILHGFTKGKKNNKYYVDIFVRYENGQFYTRLRDNAPEFNPQKRLQRDANDPTKNIGIKMVSRLAKNMYYQTTFGTNVLTIEI